MADKNTKHRNKILQTTLYPTSEKSESCSLLQQKIKYQYILFILRNTKAQTFG